MEANNNHSLDRLMWGMDLLPEDRPGVPRETDPRPLPGAHWIEPSQQPMVGPVLVRAGLERPTPVFSTALPPKGMTGRIRAAAYRFPDHFVRHWALLMLADRAEALQNLPGWMLRS
jgi:hypothetical protein